MADDLNEKKRKKNEKTEKNPKRQRSSKKRKPGFNEDIMKETEYYNKNGLRFVKPYPFTFTTYCKGRWLRRKLLDVLSQEFQSETIEYYRKAIETGNITVNEAKVNEDLILKDNDIISHKVHRHEPPVTAEPIQIVSNTDDIVVVNKPSSIPIHPCGRYRHNTLVFILGREFGLTNLYTIHRIDRLTSGIVMFAKSLGKAQELEKQLREHKLEKEYVCKVQGEFPSKIIDCNEPIAVVSHKVGVCRVQKDGKSCRTVFTREHFDGTNSIVKCQPFTGRMHQIRVHLQWLGYPIIDDPIYNHEAWGQDQGKGGVEEDKAWKVIESIAMSLRNNDTGISSKSNLEKVNKEEIVIPIEKNKETIQSDMKDDEEKSMRLTEVSDGKLSAMEEKTRVAIENDDICCEMSSSNEVITRKESEEVLGKFEKKDKVPGCTECQTNRCNPTPEELTMCLHAAVYKGPDWEFRCPWPSWALFTMNLETKDG